MSDENEFHDLGAINIPFEPIPDQEHKVTVTTCLDSVAHHLESSVMWTEGTSIPELLVATAAMAHNASKLMGSLSRAIEAAGQDGDWCLTNAAVLKSMAQALGQMAGVDDRGSIRPGVQH